MKINIKSSVIILIVVFFAVFLLTIHPLLAISKPVSADVLVIESWISISNFDEFYPLDKYRYIIIVGYNKYITKRKNAFVTIRENLLSSGVPDSLIINVFPPKSKKRKTYSFAIAVKNWLLENETSELTGCNIVSEGVHARKSYIVYRRVLSDVVNVGIYSSPPSEYDRTYWFLSLKGWEWIILDTIKTIRAYFSGY